MENMSTVVDKSELWDISKSALPYQSYISNSRKKSEAFVGQVIADIGKNSREIIKGLPLRKESPLEFL